MAVIRSGVTTDELTVDPTAKAARTTAYALSGSLGEYLASVQSGAIVATLGSGSPLFSLRWTSAINVLLLRTLSVSVVISGAITTAVDCGLEVVLARTFSASDSGGTALTLTGNNAKKRTSYATSLVADARIASTAALTVGTRTLDSQGLGAVLFGTGTAVGTTALPLTDLITSGSPDEQPIILAANEGVILRNTAAGPATGTFRVGVVLSWAELASYPA